MSRAKERELQEQWLEAVMKRNVLESGAERARVQIRRHPVRLAHRQLAIQLSEAELRELQHQLLTKQKTTVDPKALMLARNRAEIRLDRVKARIKRAKALARRRIERLEKAEAAIREIEHEMLTGESVYPLLNQVERNGQAQSPAIGLPAAPPGYSREKIDLELQSALFHRDHGVRNPWPELTMPRSGATSDNQIGEALCRIWSWSRPQYFDPRTTGTKYGHTLSVRNGVPCLWVGDFKGPDHKADLSGQELIDRVRSLLVIPGPKSEAGLSAADIDERIGNALAETDLARKEWDILRRQGASDAQIAVAIRHVEDGAKANGELVELPPFVPAPQSPSGNLAWTLGGLFNAAKVLAGGELGEVILCNRCNAARDRKHHPCPSCKCPEYRGASVGGAPASPADPVAPPAPPLEAVPPPARKRKGAKAHA